MNIPPRRTPPTEPPQDLQELQDMALAPVSQPLEIMPHKASPVESRIESVNSLLANAYSKASKLELTPEEAKALRADFPDCDFQRGANGDNNLLFLEHFALRNRLSDVVGIGQWSSIVRRTWVEEFTVPARQGKPASVACRVYVESVLIIRGCFVAEAIGDGIYYKSNASQSYGDAYESSKTAAFRRCCKEFGIGLQAFSKDWCEAWKAKYPGFERPTKESK